MNAPVADLRAKVFNGQRGGSALGMLSARVPMTGIVRVLAHASLAFKAAQERRSKWWWAAAAVSGAVDVGLAMRMRDDKYRPGVGQLIVETADAALWAGATGTDPGSPVAVMIADTLPVSAQNGLWWAAGTDALPVIDNQQAFPPRTAAEMGRVLFRAGAPIVLPAAATWVVRRRRGLRTHWLTPVWGPVTFGFVTVMARYRHRTQVDARLLWEGRAAERLDAERLAGRLGMATSSSPGHDFKKTLFALGLYGSEEAMAEARTQSDRPSALAAQFSGHTLFELARGLRIEPPEAATLWITTAQAAQVKAFLEQAFRTAKDGADQTLRVTTEPRFATRIDYLGATTVLQNEPPPFVARLNPTAPVFAAAAWLGSGSLLPGARDLHPAVAALVGAGYLAGAARFWGRPPARQDGARIAALLAVVTLPAILACATPLARLESQAYGVTYPVFNLTRASLLVLSSNWGLLPPAGRALLPAIVTGSVAATLWRWRGHGIDPYNLAAELCYGLNGLAAWRLVDRAEREAELIEVHLAGEYAARLATARVEGQRTDLAVYARQLIIARAALDKVAPILEQSTFEALRDECDELEEWLAQTERSSRHTALD